MSNVRLLKSSEMGLTDEIYFKNEEAECKLTLDRSVPSWRPDSGHLYFGEKDFFAWLPSVPEGVVAGTLVYNYDDKEKDIHYCITYKKVTRMLKDKS